MKLTAFSFSPTNSVAPKLDPYYTIGETAYSNNVVVSENILRQGTAIKSATYIDRGPFFSTYANEVLQDMAYSSRPGTFSANYYIAVGTTNNVPPTSGGLVKMSLDGESWKWLDTPQLSSYDSLAPWATEKQTNGITAILPPFNIINTVVTLNDTGEAIIGGKGTGPTARNLAILTNPYNILLSGVAPKWHFPVMPFSSEVLTLAIGVTASAPYWGYSQFSNLYSAGLGSSETITNYPSIDLVPNKVRVFGNQGQYQLGYSYYNSNIMYSEDYGVSWTPVNIDGVPSYNFTSNRNGQVYFWSSHPRVEAGSFSKNPKVYGPIQLPLPTSLGNPLVWNRPNADDNSSPINELWATNTDLFTYDGYFNSFKITNVATNPIQTEVPKAPGWQYTSGGVGCGAISNNGELFVTSRLVVGRARQMLIISRNLGTNIVVFSGAPMDDTVGLTRIAMSETGTYVSAMMTLSTGNLNNRIQILRSADAASTFNRISLTPSISSYTSGDIAMSSNGTNQLAAFVGNHGPSREILVVKYSTDAGLTWQDSKIGSTTLTLSSETASNFLRSSTVTCAITNDGQHHYVYTSAGVWRSTNYGASFIKQNTCLYSKDFYQNWIKPTSSIDKNHTVIVGPALKPKFYQVRNCYDRSFYLCNYQMTWYNNTNPFDTGSPRIYSFTATDPFTIEFWAKAEGDTLGTLISVGSDWFISLSKTQLRFKKFSIDTTISASLGVWNHIAIVRTGAPSTTGAINLRIYINGEVKASLNDVSAMASTAYNLTICGMNSLFRGLLTNLRITKQALYTGAFVPSTIPLGIANNGNASGSVVALVATNLLILALVDGQASDIAKKQPNGYHAASGVNTGPLIVEDSPFLQNSISPKSFLLKYSKTAHLNNSALETIPYNLMGIWTLVVTRAGSISSPITFYNEPYTSGFRNWSGVASSADGQYITAITSNMSLADWNHKTNLDNYDKVYVTNTGHLPYLSGLQWSVKNVANLNWMDVAVSHTGQYQTIVPKNGNIYTSINYGETWTAKSVVKNWKFIRMTPDGKFQLAGGAAALYYSSNNGDTWTVAPTVPATAAIIDGAISWDGKIQFVAEQSGALWLSVNSGVAWSAVSIYPGQAGTAVTVPWTSVHMSSAGNVLAAAGHFNTANRVNLFTSSDTGSNWNQPFQTLSENLSCEQVRVSVDGALITVTTKTKSYATFDRGYNWTEFTAASSVYTPLNPISTPQGTYSPGPEPGFSNAVLLKDGRVYCVPYQGTTARIYDPVTNTTTTPNGTYPGGPGLQQFRNGVLTSEGDVFIVPWKSTTARIYNPTYNYVYSPQGAVTTVAPDSFSSGVLLNDGKIYLIPLSQGGTAKLYDHSLETFTNAGGTYPTTGYFRGGVLMNDGRVYIIPTGGVVAPNTTAYIYNPVSNTLTAAGGSFPAGWQSEGGVLMKDGRVFCFPSDITTYVGMPARIYDPKTNSLTTPTGEYGGIIGATLLQDGRVCCIPGIINESSAIPIRRNYVFIYDPVLDTTTQTPIQTPNETFGPGGGVLMNDGRVFMVPSANPTARIYDPALDRFDGYQSRVEISQLKPISTDYTETDAFITNPFVASVIGIGDNKIMERFVDGASRFDRPTTNVILAGAIDGKIACSSNQGRNWTIMPKATNPFENITPPAAVRKITYDSTKRTFYAVGGISGSKGILATAPWTNPQTWIESTNQPLRTSLIRTIVSSAAGIFIGGDGGSIAGSSDNLSWTIQTPNMGTTAVKGLAEISPTNVTADSANTKIIAVGDAAQVSVREPNGTWNKLLLDSYFISPHPYAPRVHPTLFNNSINFAIKAESSPNAAVFSTVRFGGVPQALLTASIYDQMMTAKYDRSGAIVPEPFGSFAIQYVKPTALVAGRVTITFNKGNSQNNWRGQYYLEIRMQVPNDMNYPDGLSTPVYYQSEILVNKNQSFTFDKISQRGRLIIKITDEYGSGEKTISFLEYGQGAIQTDVFTLNYNESLSILTNTQYFSSVATDWKYKINYSSIGDVTSTQVAAYQDSPSNIKYRINPKIHYSPSLGKSFITGLSGGPILTSDRFGTKWAVNLDGNNYKPEIYSADGDIAFLPQLVINSNEDLTLMNLNSAAVGYDQELYIPYYENLESNVTNTQLSTPLRGNLSVNNSPSTNGYSSPQGPLMSTNGKVIMTFEIKRFNQTHSIIEGSTTTVVESFPVFRISRNGGLTWSDSIELVTFKPIKSFDVTKVSSTTRSLLTLVDNTLPLFLRGAAMSADGRVICLSQGYDNQASFVVSRDGGETWTRTLLAEFVAPSIPTRLLYLTSLSMSHDGSKIVGLGLSVGRTTHSILYSFNGGSSWTDIYPTLTEDFTNCCISGDGSTIVIGSKSQTSLRTTTDFGQNWTPKVISTVAVAGVNNTILTLDYTGNNAVGIGPNGLLFYTKNLKSLASANWYTINQFNPSSTPFTPLFQGVSISPDGSHAIAVGFNSATNKPLAVISKNFLDWFDSDTLLAAALTNAITYNTSSLTTNLNYTDEIRKTLLWNSSTLKGFNKPLYTEFASVNIDSTGKKILLQLNARLSQTQTGRDYVDLVCSLPILRNAGTQTVKLQGYGSSSSSNAVSHDAGLYWKPIPGLVTYAFAHETNDKSSIAFTRNKLLVTGAANFYLHTDIDLNTHNFELTGIPDLSKTYYGQRDIVPVSQLATTITYTTANDVFRNIWTGFSIDISKNGAVLAIGEPNRYKKSSDVFYTTSIDNINREQTDPTWGTRLGSVTMYTISANSTSLEWNLYKPTPTSKAVALSGTMTDMEFGRSVATNRDGSTVIIGAPRTPGYTNLNPAFALVDVGEDSSEYFIEYDPISNKKLNFANYSSVAVSSAGTSVFVACEHSQIMYTSYDSPRFEFSAFPATIYTELSTTNLHFGLSDFIFRGRHHQYWRDICMNPSGRAAVAVAGRDAYYESGGTSAGQVRVYRAVNTPDSIRIYNDVGLGYKTYIGWRYGSSMGEYGGINGKNPNDFFGNSIAINSDGDIIAIGSVDANTKTGVIRVYHWNSNFSKWLQLGSDIVGGKANDQFGVSVSINRDCALAYNNPYSTYYVSKSIFIAVGSAGFDVPSTTTTDDRGLARVYKYDWEMFSTEPFYHKGTWTQIGNDVVGSASTNRAGFKVSLSNIVNDARPLLAVSSIQHDANSLTNCGSVRVLKTSVIDNGYRWDTVGIELVGTNSNEYFGFSTSLKVQYIGGWDRYVRAYLAVGSHNNTGFVKTLSCEYSDLAQVNAGYGGGFGATWRQLANTLTQNGTQTGYSVSLNAAGNVLAVGRPGTTNNSKAYQGAVDVYSLSNGQWVARGPRVFGIVDFADTRFGASLELDDTGDWLAVGAPGLNRVDAIFPTYTYTEPTAAAPTNSYAMLFKWNSSRVNDDSTYGAYETALSRYEGYTEMGVDWGSPGAIRDDGIRPFRFTGISQDRIGYSVSVSNALGNGWNAPYDSPHLAVSHPQHNAPPREITGIYKKPADEGAFASLLSLECSLGKSLANVGIINWSGCAMSNDERIITAVAECFTNSVYATRPVSKSYIVTLSAVSDATYVTYRNTNINNALAVWSSEISSNYFGAGLGSRNPSAHRYIGVRNVIEDASIRFTGVSMCSAGQYQLVSRNSNQLYRSIDYGKTWTNTGVSGPWSCVKVSQKGYLQVAAVDNGSLYVSNDFGANWTLKATSRRWKDIDINLLDENVIVAVAACNVTYDVGSASPLNDTYKFSGLGADLDKAGGIFFSFDKGNTWSQPLSGTRDVMWSSIQLTAKNRLALTKRVPRIGTALGRIIKGYQTEVTTTGHTMVVNSTIYGTELNKYIWSIIDPGYVQVYAYNNNSKNYEQKGQTLIGQLPGEQFGESVCMSDDGNVIAVGAPYSLGTSLNKFNSGLARIYTFSSSTSTWNLSGTFTGAFHGAQLGTSVSLNAAGNVFAVGSPGIINPGSGLTVTDADLPSVSVYDWTNTSTTPFGSWTLRANKKIANTFTYIEGGQAPPPFTTSIEGTVHARSFFGKSIKLNDLGDMIIIGAPRDGSSQSVQDFRGSCMLLKWEPNITKWRPLHVSYGSDANQQHGFATSINGIGDRIAIGSPYVQRDLGFPSDERFQIYNASKLGSVRTVDITNGNSTIIQGTSAADMFGFSVALNRQGDVLAVGAPLNDNVYNGSNRLINYNIGAVKTYNLPFRNSYKYLWNQVTHTVTPADPFQSPVSLVPNFSIGGTGAPRFPARCIAASPEAFMVGSKSVLSYSTDAINWKSCTIWQNPLLNNGNVNATRTFPSHVTITSIAYGDGHFCAVGTHGTILLSRFPGSFGDFSNFRNMMEFGTSQSNPTLSAEGHTLTKVVYDNSSKLFIATGKKDLITINPRSRYANPKNPTSSLNSTFFNLASTSYLPKSFLDKEFYNISPDNPISIASTGSTILGLGQYGGITKINQF